MRRFFQLTLWAVLLGLAGGATYFRLIGNNSVFSFFVGLFLTDLLIIIGERLYIPVLAYFQMWDIAAEKDQEQQMAISENQALIEKGKKELDDLQEYYKSRERLARGELVELKDVRDKNWVGAEVSNNEKDNPFNGVVYVTGVTNHSFSPPIRLDNWTGRDLHILPNGNKETVKIAFYNETDGTVYVYPQNAGIKFSESGEYFIETMLEGRFFKNSFDLVYKTNKWKLIFEKENRFFDLRKVD